MAELDAKATWLRKAAEAYNSGQYGECEKCLQEALSHVEAFSRLRWGVESNQLACRLQRAVATDELEEICSGYALLWGKAMGLPPNADSVPTEVAVVCATCQLAVMLEAQSSITTKFTLEWSTQHCSTLVSRICNYFGVEENCIGQALPALIESLRDSVVNEDAFAVKGILKLMFLRAMMYLIHDEREDGAKLFSSIRASLNRQPEDGGDQKVFDIALQTKRLVAEALTSEDAVLSSEYEHKYNEAWLLFNRDEYHLALDTLHTLLHTSSLPHITSSVARLLAGGCYASMHKPNLALCSYQQCLRSSSNVAVVPALHSCATVYRTMGNAEAEMGMRKILLEALKLQEEHKATHEKWPGAVVWSQTSHGLRGKKVSLHPAVPSGPELLNAIYTIAHRAKQLHRYKESAAAFMEIIRILESGCKALPPSLPPPSTLYLLTIRSMLCSAEHEQADLLCSKLVDTFLPRAESWLSASNPSSTQTNTTATVGHVLILAQALYFRAIATIYLNKVQESRVYCQRCLNLIDFMLLRLTEGDEPQMLDCIKSVQAHALNHLAVLSIGQRKNSQALRLLTEALASSAKPADNHPSLGMESDSNTGTARKESPPSTSDIPSSSYLPLVYNHCLLQCKLGKMVDAAHGWLEERGGLPTTVQEGRQGLAEAKKTLASLKREGKDHYLAAMDAAMLGVWLRRANR